MVNSLSFLNAEQREKDISVVRGKSLMMHYIANKHKLQLLC